MVRWRFLFAIAGLISALSAPAADWPEWRGPHRDGKSTETGLLKKWPAEGPKLLWTFEDTGVGYGSPSIVGKRLYILGSEDPAKGDKEFALCIDAAEGKEIWRTPLETGKGDYSYGWGSGPRSSPTVDADGKHVYALGAKGDLVCLETEKGKVVWRKHLVADLGGGIPTWGYSESVLIDGDNLICTPGGKKGTIAAFKKKDGELIWRSTDLTDPAAYSSIVVNNFGGKHYVQMVGGKEGGVVGVRPSDGKLLWRNKKAGANGVAVIPTPILDDKYVFATSGYGSGCGLVELTAGTDGSIGAKDVYLTKTMQNHHGGVIRLNDYIYGYSDKGGWMCLDFKKDGEEPVWKSSKLDKGSITYADGHFYCYGEGKGTLVMIEANPKAWVEVNRMEMPKKSKYPRRDGKIWTHPVVANGKLYLRDHELLFCYDVAGK